jgi:outer membrane immunogenic protein
MRRLLLLTTLLATPAFGADLPVKGPVQGFAPTYTSDPFSGFYIGANLGYGWNSAAGTATDTEGTFIDFKNAPQGFVGGLHAGFGGRFAQVWYLGIEGDGDIATLDGSLGSPGGLSTTSKNRWLASIRARFGIIPVGHAMLYATAGYGVGGSEFTLTALSQNMANLSPTQSGLVAGGGIEIPFTANWLGRVEYLHYAFGDLNANVGSVAIKVNDRVDVVRGGLSYKF